MLCYALHAVLCYAMPCLTLASLSTRKACVRSAIARNRPEEKKMMDEKERRGDRRAGGQEESKSRVAEQAAAHAVGRRVHVRAEEARGARVERLVGLALRLQRTRGSVRH